MKCFLEVTMSESVQTYFKLYAFQKFFVGLSGLALSLFVLMHMVGNITILLGAESYNKVSFALTENPLFEIAELGLLFLFLVHIILAVLLTIINKRARKETYKHSASGAKKTTLVQKTLAPQGVILLIFVVVHLIQFKWGTHYTVFYEGIKMRDFFLLAQETFQNIWSLLLYVVAIFILGLHLRNGLAASLQSLGLAQSDQPWLQKLSLFYAIIITIGFMLGPIYLFIMY